MVWPAHAPTGSIFSPRSEDGSKLVTGGMLGSRGLRSHSAPARPVPVSRLPEPPPAPAVAPRAPPAPRAGVGMGPLVGVAVGWLIAGALIGAFGPEGKGLGFGLLHQVLLGGAVVVLVMFLRRLRAAPAPPARRPVSVPGVPHDPPPAATSVGRPSDGSSLDEGVRDIRRMDPKFDPVRFTGYIEMVFAGTHKARMNGDIDSLRDRVTPEMYGELQAQYERLRSLRHASHVGQIDIRAEVTEAWHENGRDYVTAYLAGSMLDYTVDEATGALVNGSKTILDKVEAFLTFTRPAGLNPWMLSAIQTA
jgi:predicted lipid-binding transport protein (Tim44 family)